MKDITAHNHRREITSYKFDVQLRVKFKQLFFALCIFPKIITANVQLFLGTDKKIV
jgi:hypothetical protein